MSHPVQWHEATWYDGQGQVGACGRVLGSWKLHTRLYVAHKTFPCGTRLTLHRGGRQVHARVWDRGPYGGADIDLAPRVFARLAPLGAGRIHVRITRGW